MIKGIIFDLDGVIVRTDHYHYLAWREVSRLHNLVFNQEINESLKGLSRVDCLRIICYENNVKLEQAEFDQIIEQKNEIFLDYLVEMSDVDLIRGVREFIIKNHEKYALAVASSGLNTHLILDMLGLTSYFKLIIDGSVVTKRKPDPEIYQLTVSTLGLNPSECVVFEDAISGVVGAKTLGCKTVGITNRLVMGVADYFIRDFVNLDIDELIR